MNFKKAAALVLSCGMVGSSFYCSAFASEPEVLTADKQKVRTIITTDGEADDQCSLIRYLLYSNEFNLEGIVSTSSMFHFTDQGEGMFKGKDSNQTILDEYAKVYENLSKHAEGYPTPEFLTEHNYEGNVTKPGEMDTDTEGSLFIKDVIMDDSEDRLLLQAWGGVNTIAAALRSIEDDYKDTDQWEEVYNKVCNKIVIVNDLDQDNTVTQYLFDHWPNVAVLMTYSQYVSMAYPGDRPHFIPADLDQQYYSAEWMSENIKGKGALADKYYEILDSDERSQGAFLSEGDSPCFLYGLDVGLRSFEDPSFGGWGGRYGRVYMTGNGYDTTAIPWSSSTRLFGYFVAVGDDGDYAKALYRWIPAFQTDWAARMNWCVSSYEDANHEPVIQIEEGTDLQAKRGETVTLNAKTYDPDGDQVSVKFWQYHEADTYGGMVDLNAADSQVSFVVPEDAKTGDTIHVIAEATDDDEKTPITRYQRVIVTAVDEPAEDAAE